PPAALCPLSLHDALPIVQMAQHLGAGSSYSQFSVDDNDTASDLRNKVFESTIGSLLTVRDELDPAVLDRAIDALCDANRVEFYGDRKSTRLNSSHVKISY